MGMTIDDVIAEYNAWKITISENVSPDCVDALDMAIETMRKYQQLQSDYENRLKADMVAILTEIQLEIEEMSGLVTEIHGEEWNEVNVINSQDVLSFIQQKINSLKE